MKSEIEQCFITESIELMPVWLSTEAKKVWRELGPLACSTGRLLPEYADAFGQLCEIRYRLVKWRKELDTDGWVYKTEGGRNGDLMKQNPLAAIYNQNFVLYISLSGKFGLSPKAAKGMAAGGAFDAEDAAFDAL